MPYVTQERIDEIAGEIEVIEYAISSIEKRIDPSENELEAKRQLAVRIEYLYAMRNGMYAVLRHRHC